MMELGLLFTQPLTEMSTTNRKIMLLGSKVRPVVRADSLAAVCEPIVYNVGSLTSHNSIHLQGLLRGQLYFSKAKLYD
jgi:hypothetical protein